MQFGIILNMHFQDIDIACWFLLRTPTPLTTKSGFLAHIPQVREPVDAFIATKGSRAVGRRSELLPDNFVAALGVGSFYVDSIDVEVSVDSWQNQCCQSDG